MKSIHIFCIFFRQLRIKTVCLSIMMFSVFMLQALCEETNSTELNSSLNNLKQFARKTLYGNKQEQLWVNDQLIILQNLKRQIESKTTANNDTVQLNSMIHDFKYMLSKINDELKYISKHKGLPIKSFNVRNFGAKGNGKVNDSNAIQQAITTAAKHIGPAEVIFPAGTYLLSKPIQVGIPVKNGIYTKMVADKKYIPKDFGTWINCPANHKAHLLLNGISKLKLKGEGKVTLLCSDPHLGAVMLKNCTNVVLENLIINYQTLPFAQGKIVAVNLPEKFDAEMTTGFPAADSVVFSDSDSKGIVRFYSASNIKGSPRPKISSVRPYTYLKKISKVNGNVFRFTIGKQALRNTKTLRPGIQIGLYARMWSQAAITFLTSNRCRAEKISIYTAPAMAFILSDSSMITINQCIVEAAPESKCYASTCADAVFINNCPFGISITNNAFRHTGDDFINIHSFYRPALRQIENVLFVPVHYWDISLLKPGRRIGLIKSGSYYINFETRIREVTIVKDKTHPESKFGLYRIVCEKKLPKISTLSTVPKGQLTDMLVLPDNLCHGWVIRNNLFDNGLSRMLLGGRNGLFINNRIIETLGSPDFMTIGSRSMRKFGGEGAAPRNIQVSNNNFECYYPKSIIRLRSPGKNKTNLSVPLCNIIISNNHIVFKGASNLWAGAHAKPVFDLNNSVNLFISDNTFEAGAFKLKNAIRLGACHNVLINDNTFKNEFANTISIPADAMNSKIIKKNNK